MTTKLSAALLGVLLAAASLSTRAQAPAPIASQETNWNGVTAEVTEFKRKGNTLSVKVKLRNDGKEKAQAHLDHRKAYLLDANAGKKYEMLKDDAGKYLAALTGGYPETFVEDIPAGQSKTVWMKFPAPPATTKTITLAIDGVQPFEDVQITDQ